MVGPLPLLLLFWFPAIPPMPLSAGSPIMAEPTSRCSSPMRSTFALSRIGRSGAVDASTRIAVSSRSSRSRGVRPERAAARSACSAIQASMTTGTRPPGRGASTAGRGSSRSGRRISSSPRPMLASRSGSRSSVGATTIIPTRSRTALMAAIKPVFRSRSSGISSVLARYTVGRGGGGAGSSALRG